MPGPAGISLKHCSPHYPLFIYSWECGFVTSSDELKQKRRRRKGGRGAGNEAEGGRGDPAHLFFRRSVGRHLPSPWRRGEVRSEMWRPGVGGERARGENGLPELRIRPEADHPWVIRQKPPAGSCLCFLLPRPPRHSPATCSSSNGSAIAHGETRSRLPIWGGAERPGLSRNGHKVALPHKMLYFFYFELFKLYFYTPTGLFSVDLKKKKRRKQLSTISMEPLLTSSRIFLFSYSCQ